MNPQWFTDNMPDIRLLLEAFTGLGVVASILKSFYNGKKLDTIEIKIDGRMEELLRMAALHAEIAGNIAGRREERTETAAALAEVIKAQTEVPTPP